jgi:batC protein
MERILEAMNNEERKTQDKVNGQKVRGQRAKSEKDW